FPSLPAPSRRARSSASSERENEASRNGDRLEPTGCRQFKNKWFNRGVNSRDDPIVRAHEVPHLVPSRGTGARKIEAARLVLFNSRALWQDRVEFSIVAEYNPSFSGNFRQPFVIRRVLR